MSTYLIGLDAVEQYWDRRNAALWTRKGFVYNQLLDGTKPEDIQGLAYTMESYDRAFLWSGIGSLAGIVASGFLHRCRLTEAPSRTFRFLSLGHVILPSETPMPWSPQPRFSAGRSPTFARLADRTGDRLETEWQAWRRLKICPVLEGGVVRRSPGRKGIPQVSVRCTILFRQGLDLRIWKKCGWWVDNSGQPTHEIELLLDSPSRRRHPLAITACADGGEPRYILNTAVSGDQWLLTEAHRFFGMDRRPFRQVLAMAGMIAPSRAGIDRNRLIGDNYDRVDISARLAEIRPCAARAIYACIQFYEGEPLPLPRRVTLDTRDFDPRDDLEEGYVYYGD
jgi:hypothetical protein